MRAALLALAVLGVAAIPVEATAQTMVQRLRDACIATDMNRNGFDRAFADSGFEPLIPVVRPGETPSPDWMSGFSDNGFQMVMEGQPGSAEATDCGVLDPRPTGDWRSDVDRLAEELGMTPLTPEDMPNVLEARSWSASGDRPLTLHYELYREAVVVRFALASANSQ